MQDTALELQISKLREQLRSINERKVRLTEADTIRVLVHPMLRALGWRLEDIEETRSEYRHRSNDNPVDCALFLQRSPVLFVEAKPLDSRLFERKWIIQTLNYANAAAVDWCVLTNGDEFRIYKVHHAVEAEEKLFLTLKIDSEQPVEDLARLFRLLSRDQMSARTIDTLWQQWHIDRLVQEALDGLIEDSSFAKLVHRRINGGRLQLSEVRQSLHRAALSFSFPDSSEIRLPRQVEVVMPQEVTAASLDDDAATDVQIASRRPGRKTLPKVADLLAAGLLAPGAKLTIRNWPNSEATVIDGRRVSFGTEELSYNEWGCRVTGWSAIQIYVHAQTEDGQLLQDLRGRL